MTWGLWLQTSIAVVLGRLPSSRLWCQNRRRWRCSGYARLDSDGGPAFVARSLPDDTSLPCARRTAEEFEQEATEVTEKGQFRFCSSPFPLLPPVAIPFLRNSTHPTTVTESP